MISSECNGCEYQCKLSHIDICTLGSPCPHQRSTPMTNEEWLRQCTTEQLAEEIYECVMTHPWHISKEVILEWLKLHFVVSWE